MVRTLDFVTDLSGPAKVIQSGHVMFYSTDLRDRFRVLVTQNGAPASLADQTISGAVMRPDGETVTSGFTIEKETEGTGIAAITLPSECYAYPGTAYVVIHGSDSLGHPLTLLAAQVRVARVTSDVIVDPGDVVPSVAELLAQIEACEEATAAAVEFLDGAEDRIEALETILTCTDDGYGNITFGEGS